jgi:LPXTG-site transpeptidase (sortase) family protein
MVGEVVATTTEVGISINDIQKNPELNVPVRIKIDRIGLDSTILTPASADIDVLDRALLSGAVHYPGSGLLGENANMLLFGHSSYLPVVHNKAFKAFNELGTLKKGDIVIVFSESHKFTYVVDNVLLSDAEDVLVRFDSPKPMLTLATCNTFGAKEERWIVTATLLSKEIW